jgi:hypothetical protein
VVSREAAKGNAEGGGLLASFVPYAEAPLQPGCVEAFP